MFPLLLSGVAGKAAASAVWDVLIAFFTGCCSATSLGETTAGVCAACSSCLRFGAQCEGVVVGLRLTKAGLWMEDGRKGTLSL
jgi:hypothetical protein